MIRSERVLVVPIVAVLVIVAAVVAYKMGSGLWRFREKERVRRQTVIRRPAAPPPTAGRSSRAAVANIAPFAIVTVSSNTVADAGVGVADGVVDAQEWVAENETGGAWIRLAWDTPATISEVSLYDRASLANNVLSGHLEFEDGSTIAVPALPRGGAPWRIAFPAKTVHWVEFHIDSAEGASTGLAEMVVMGTLHP
jgi:hypothetical protein